MIFIDMFKANREIGILQQSIKDVTEDRDKQLGLLKEFEAKNKDFIESAQTAESMKVAHEKAIADLKAEYEAKLVAKEQAIEATKVVVEQTKESVAEETIRILANQGTTAAIELQPVAVLTKDQALAELNKLKGVEATLFYQKHKQLFV